MPKEAADISQESNKQSDNNPLVGQEFTISKGILVTFDKQDGELQAYVKFDQTQQEPNYTNLPVAIEDGTDLAELSHLTKETQQFRIQLGPTQHEKPSHVIISKGGMMEGNEGPKSQGKEKNKKNRVSKKGETSQNNSNQQGEKEDKGKGKKDENWGKKKRTKSKRRKKVVKKIKTPESIEEQNIAELPLELWDYIFSYLKYPELQLVNHTNRAFRLLVQRMVFSHLRDAIIAKDTITVCNLTYGLGVDVNARYEDGMTALHFAAQQSFGKENSEDEVSMIGIITALLEKGADLKAKNDNKQTPIQLAVGKESWGLTKLLSRQRDENSIKNKKQTNLHEAAYNGANTTYIEELIELASMKGIFELASHKPEAIASYKRKKQYINAQDRDGMTALHIAVNKGHLSIAEYLMQVGAKVNVKNRKQQTPLHLSVNKGYIDIVRLLLDKRANVNIKSYDGKTPLNLAHDRGNTEITKLLEEHVY